MNKERLLTVANYIEDENFSIMDRKCYFTMSAYFIHKESFADTEDMVASMAKEGKALPEDCDTMCCIAGATCILFNTDVCLSENGIHGGNVPHPFIVAKNLLGITNDQASDLFHAHMTTIKDDGKLAAKMVREFVKTGVVFSPKDLEFLGIHERRNHETDEFESYIRVYHDRHFVEPQYEGFAPRFRWAICDEHGNPTDETWIMELRPTFASAEGAYLDAIGD